MAKDEIRATIEQVKRDVENVKEFVEAASKEASNNQNDVMRLEDDAIEEDLQTNGKTRSVHPLKSHKKFNI